MYFISRYFYFYFLCTFCADRKYERTLRMDAFLTPNEADDFWVLRNSFSYPRPACITNSQTVFAFGELWPHSLCNLQVNLRYARLHKLSHYSRKTYGLSLCPLTVPEVFRSYQCLRFYCLFIRKGYFKENTALSKSQATAAVKGAEKSVKVFLRAVAQLNFHTPA